MPKEIPYYYVLEEKNNIFDSKKIFEIPLYQREFAWGYKQITELIDDIYDFEGTTYYIGSLVVSEKLNSYEIIDGQQRLTALYLLLNFISQKDISLGQIKHSLKYACRDKSNYTLERIIDVINNNKNLESSNLEDNIIDGLDIIKQYFESNKLDLSRFISNLKKVVIFRIEVPEDTDLNRYFEIMNTRGEQLEQQDILKANLMSYLSTDDAKIFSTIWNACRDMSGYVQMHFRYSSTVPRRKIFGSTWNELPSDKWEAYTFLTDFSPKSVDEEDEIYEKYQSIIDFPYFLLHVLRTFLRSKNIENVNTSLDDKKLLKSFQNVLKIYEEKKHESKFSKEFILHLLQERFLFDKYFIKRKHETPEDDGEWSLQEIKENDGKKQPVNTTGINQRNVLMLQAALRVSYTSPKNMNWITNSLYWLFDNNLRQIDKYEDAVEDIIREAIINNYFMIQNFTMLGVSTPHIVFNYLDYLLWKDDKTKRNSFVFEFRNSVEHWYPQNPSEDTFPKWDTVNTFGNLCIIQRNINSRFSNKTPESKMQDHKPMIDKGSLKLRLMRDNTVKGNYPTPHENWMNNACKSHEELMLKKLLSACINYSFLSKEIYLRLLKDDSSSFEEFISNDYQDFKIIKLKYNKEAFIYFTCSYNKDAFEIGYWSYKDSIKTNEELRNKIQNMKFPDEYKIDYFGIDNSWIYKDFSIKGSFPKDLVTDIKALLLSLK